MSIGYLARVEEGRNISNVNARLMASIWERRAAAELELRVSFAVWLAVLPDGRRVYGIK